MHRRRPRRKSAASDAEPRATHDDAGTGLVSTLAGVVVFLAFLLLAVQSLVDLCATSVVTAVAYDAARMVSTSSDPSDPAVLAAAEADARTRLGPYADRVVWTWHIDADSVRL